MQSPRHAMAAVLVLLVAVALASDAAAQIEQEYSDEKAVACLDCHETEPVMGIFQTVHANFDDPRTPAAQRQCQSCHGPSKVHMQFPMQVENVHFGKGSKASPQVQNAACLACHADDESRDWSASAHGFENLVCSTCHSLHSPEKIVPSRANVIETCTQSGCHADLMKNANPADFSHTTGIEIGGKRSFVCSDCHNPHGPLGSGRCSECHAQSPELLAKQSEKAQRYHEVAAARGTECMSCHRGLAHPLPEEILEDARSERDQHAD